VIEAATIEAAVREEFGADVAYRVPAYRGLGESLALALMEATIAAPVVCLVPARTDTRWWWDYCLQGQVRVFRGRVRFAGQRSGAPFPSALVVFGREPAWAWWDLAAGLAPEYVPTEVRRSQAA
jgi:site-specific DNA-methyltransferase (adenine-specific)